MAQMTRRVAWNPPPSDSPRSARARVVRLAVFWVAVFLLQAGALPAEAATNLQPVTLRLDWVYGGPTSGFLAAKDKGFYSDAGLDVTIGPGKRSGSTAQLVAAKADMIGFADGYVVGNSVARGMSRTRTDRRLSPDFRRA